MKILIKISWFQNSVLILDYCRSTHALVYASFYEFANVFETYDGAHGLLLLNVCIKTIRKKSDL